MTQTKMYFCIYSPDHPCLPKRHEVYSAYYVEWSHVWNLR